MAVEPLLLQESFMRAMFFDLSIVNDENLIRIEDGRQTMSDDKRSTAYHKRIQRRLNDLLALRIQG